MTLFDSIYQVGEINDIPALQDIDHVTLAIWNGLLACRVKYIFEVSSKTIRHNLSPEDMKHIKSSAQITRTLREFGLRETRTRTNNYTHLSYDDELLKTISKRFLLPPPELPNLPDELTK